MMIIDEIQILDDIELDDIVGGQAKKKVAKKKTPAKKPAKKRHPKVPATSNGGSSVVVDAHALKNAQGLT